MGKRWAVVIGAAAVGVLALVATGCGGDDDEETTTAALSKQEFIKQADQICAKGDKQIDQAAKDVFAKGQRPSKQEQEQFVTDTVIPSIQKQVNEIDALPLPKESGGAPSDQEQINGIIDSAQNGLNKAENNPALMTQPGSDPLAEATKLAKDYGLKVCGQG
jgi:hypothetical protein